MASELVGTVEWPYKQARVNLRKQGTKGCILSQSGSDGLHAIDEVAKSKVHVAIINPAALVTLAFRGTGPFKEPIPLRAIAVISSQDQLAFAVTERSGLTSLVDIRERRFPLRVFLRGHPRSSVHSIVNQVLFAVGISLEDIVSWGGEVRYEARLPDRIGAVKRGEVDAIFDEAVGTWVNMALDLGMRFLHLEGPLLQHLEKLGFRRAALTKVEYPKLVQDVTTLDFSGWPIFTHVKVPDEVITPFCAALEERKDRILRKADSPLPLERMCRDTPEGPLDIPLHSAAERFWRERGYLM